jgi:type II secretory pathway pseudopilin PulG
MRIFLWIGGIVGLLFLGFIFQLARPNSGVTISKQTTFITAPLRRDGLPDYEQNVRQKMSEGVTPENNAAVLLVQALWPSELQPEQYELVLKELGLGETPHSKSAMQPVYGEVTRKQVLDWMPKANAGDAEPDASPIIDSALDHSWTGQQIPPLAKWVDANQKPLDLIVEASRRPRYYSPSPTLIDNHHDILVSMLLPGAQAVRDAARGLSLRAMRRIGENQLKDAWRDILAIYRLSALVAQGPTIVEQLVAMALRGIACQATAVLLSSDRLTNEIARQIQQDLATVTPFSNLANCVDQMERISTLDSVVYASIYGFDALGEGAVPNASRAAIEHSSVDWNIILRKLNGEYDEAAAAMRLPSGAERRRAFNKFNAKLEKEAGRNKQIGLLITAVFSRSTRSDLIGSIFAALMMPALDAASNAEDRTNSVLALTQLAAAIAVYRTSHDAYPEKIEALVPAVINKLPVDFYLGKPFVYKRLNDGYLIYTVGLNGKDDSGSNNQMSTFEGRPLNDLDPTEAEALREKIPTGADDFSIRIPQPQLKLPTASSIAPKL